MFSLLYVKFKENIAKKRKINVMKLHYIIKKKIISQMLIPYKVKKVIN